MKLKAKTAIVTGASQGIGGGIALGLAEAGADVTVNYHQNIDGEEGVANEIRNLGRQAKVVQGDSGR